MHTPRRHSSTVTDQSKIVQRIASPLIRIATQCGIVVLCIESETRHPNIGLITALFCFDIIVETITQFTQPGRARARLEKDERSTG